jgi:hypothetical protein
VLAIVAAGVITVALLVIWRLQPKQETAVKSPPAPIQTPANPLVADTGNQQKPQAATEIACFEPVTVELPSRWRGAGSPQKPIVLPRAHLQLEVRLPISSSEGIYKFRILVTSGKARITASRITRTRNGVTSAKVPLDTPPYYPAITNSASLSRPSTNEPTISWQ